MSDVNELLQKVQTLLDEKTDKKYIEIIALLTDEVLAGIVDKENKSKLYACRGLAFGETAKQDNAIADYTAAITINPDYAEAYRNRGNRWYSKGDNDIALGDYTQAISIYEQLSKNDQLPVKENLASAYCGRGNSWQNKGYDDKAIDDYNEAILLKPDYTNSFYNRGNSWQNKGDNDKAIADFNQAIALKPDHAEALNNRGISFNNNHEYDKAIDDYNAALLLKPDYAEAFNNRGIVWFNRGEYDRGIEDYNAAIKLRSDFVQAYYNRGNLWIEKGEYDKAIAESNMVITLDKKSYKGYLLRGNAWFLKAEYDKAIDDNTALATFYPDDAIAFYSLGLSLSAKGEEDLAIEAYSKAIKLKPDYKNTYVGLGYSYASKGDYDQAIQNYNLAIDLKPDDAIPFNNRGLIWANKADYKKAIGDYLEAIRIDPKLALPYKNLGDAYYSQEQFREALNSYWKSINLGIKDINVKYQIDLIKTKLGEIVTPPEDDGLRQDSLYYLLDTIDQVQDNNAKDLLAKSGIEMVIALNKMYDYARFDNNQDVAHYTKLSVADALVSIANDKKDEAKFRYYNAVYMNDPEEGEILLDYMDEGSHEHCRKIMGKSEDSFMHESEEKTVRKSFGDASRGDENNVYLGSFMLASKDGKTLEHEDDLVMWRTYGKDENKNEAAGCSMVIRNDFFDKQSKSSVSESRKKRDSRGLLTTANFMSGENLYKVLYYDKKLKKFANDEGDRINRGMDEFRKLLIALVQRKDDNDEMDNAINEMNNAINRLVYRFLAELRFMVKSADYATENEIRIIQYRLRDSGYVKIDDNGKERLPRRVYTESQNAVLPYLKKIILGPKVPNHDQWVYLDVAMRKKGYEIDLLYSECKYQ
jgi:tetratricopeptide (TPR) repeat protein